MSLKIIVEAFFEYFCDQYLNLKKT